MAKSDICHIGGKPPPNVRKSAGEVVKAEQRHRSTIAMDPVTDVAVSLKLQAALVPYRTRTEEDALLDLKASKSQVATLETSLQSTNAAVALKANAADVYTRDTVDQRIAISVDASSSTSSDAINALAQNITSAVSTLNQNLANAQTQLTTQISGKVSTDAWPGMVIAAKTEAANAANAAVQQTTQDLQAQMASKAPLQAPSFTGPVKVNGQDVVLTNDERLSIRGPTGPQGLNGSNGTAGPTGVAGPTGGAGATGPAAAGGGSAYGRFNVTSTTVAPSGVTPMSLGIPTNLTPSSITLQAESGFTSMVTLAAGVYVVQVSLSVLTTDNSMLSIALASWNAGTSVWDSAAQTTYYNVIREWNTVTSSHMVTSAVSDKWRVQIGAIYGGTVNLHSSSRVVIFKVG